MALECGIVGLPNVGKSTLFNALTSAAKAAAENFPFCTIEPNVGVVEVPDLRLEKIAEIFKPEKILPTTVTFVDIAGLVKGASKGEGLGNQFLGNIKNCDAIAHVVRCFDDGDVIHVEGSVDPLRDVETIETELLLADLSTVEKRKDRLSKQAKSGDKKTIEVLTVIEKVQKSLEDGEPVRKLELTKEEKLAIADLHLITIKPLIYVANVDEDHAAEGSYEELAHFKAIQERANKEGAQVVPVCAKIEAELAGMTPEEKAEFLTDLGIKEPGLARLIRGTYTTLGLSTYFTAGPKEVRAWTITEGALAPQAAGVIHGDFERGFICAETYHYEDLMSLGSEARVKESGKMRTEGKQYVVKDGDLLHFRFNV